MEDNSPECISRNILRALKHPKLDIIAQNAHMFVEKEFTFDRAVERYQPILSKIKGLEKRL